MIGERQRTDVAFPYIVEASRSAKGNCQWRQIDPDVFVRIAEALQNCARATTKINNRLVTPIGQFPFQNAKDQPMEGPVPPVRLLNTKHCRVFIRAHLAFEMNIG
jgi:hypothetical protein